MAGQEGLTNAVKVHDEGIRGYLEEFKGFVTEKLDQVFRFVSNGKSCWHPRCSQKVLPLQSTPVFRSLLMGF